jgi:hypothetical protein
MRHGAYFEKTPDVARSADDCRLSQPPIRSVNGFQKLLDRRAPRLAACNLPGSTRPAVLRISSLAASPNRRFIPRTKRRTRPTGSQSICIGGFHPSPCEGLLPVGE